MKVWAAVLAVVAAVGRPGWAVETELVPVTAASTPFFAAAIDLAAHGYVEEEYFLTGTGNVYEYDAQGEVRVQTADVPYRTRMLVRRPAAAAFNGVVLLEMMNPTAGYDIDFEWHFNRELLLKEGYVWAGITIKDTAIAYLEGWDPERYATLEMSDRGLAYDVFAQAGALLRDASSAENPLAGYDVDVVIGTGYSQSADYLTTFSNEFHETALAGDGRHAFDGYLHGGGNGAARRINSADPELYLDDRRLNGVDAPLIRVQSETEVAVFSFPSVTTRQPDSDVFRVYEIAGGSHADAEILQRTGDVQARDIGTAPLPPCGQPLSPLAIGPMHRASLANLVRWIVEGKAPPPSRLIALDAGGEVVRDAFGNARGGVRVPTIDVPLGSFAPANTGPPPCPLAGTFTAFDETTLSSLYPSHDRYVALVAWSALRNLRERLLLWDDAARYVIEAILSDVGE